MFKSDLQKLRNALEFTRIYKENSGDIYIREAKCLDFQLRRILVPLDENDGIAGRYEHDFAGFTSQVGGYSALIGGQYTYYFNDFDFTRAMLEHADALTAEEKRDLQAAQAFWHEENTARKLDIAFAKRYGYIPPKGYQGPGAGNCDCRVIIGGLGRKRPEAADRLAIVIMEASRRFREVVPQLTLRYYSGMDERVFQKAMEVNAEGTTFPIIYSDDTNIPAVEKVYGVSREEAEQYVPFGCGEYVLVGRSVGTPNNGINALKALEMALHNGLDKFQNVRCGVETGPLTAFDTFEKLYAAVLEQLYPVIDRFAVQKYLNYTVAGENAPYLHLSLLLDDCIARGKPVFEGGVRYLNASSEMFGIISCADSLTAIKTLVYDGKRFTLEQFVHMLDCDFEGFEAERKLCLEAPKYGNDDDAADAMAARLFADLADRTVEAGKAAGLDHYNIVSVNNSMSAEWGSLCEASACGRKRGSAMANANGASIGADKSGITALLNSMSKFDNTKHVGVINNVRFTKELFSGSMDKVGAVLKAFYENGGVQTNLCVIGRDDLENAMAHPENYQNLLVRIGGFSARFVTLNPVVQREIIERTTYGA